MRILAVSDIEAKALYDFYRPGKLDGYDLILAAGDLKKKYLEFLVTMAHAPVLYVRGNHDEGMEEDPPEGCDCIDGKIYVYKGIRILGLGGSYRYRPGENLYTERQMRHRIFKLWFSLKKHKGFDILLTHAPARGLGDLEDLAHRGFDCFKDLLDRYHPAYMIHGHVHRNYGTDIPRKTAYGDTEIINAYESFVFDYPLPGNTEGKQTVS